MTHNEANIDAMNDISNAHIAYVTPCCESKPEFEEVQDTMGYTHVVICECGNDCTDDYVSSVW